MEDCRVEITIKKNCGDLENVKKCSRSRETRESVKTLSYAWLRLFLSPLIILAVSAAAEWATRRLESQVFVSCTINNLCAPINKLYFPSLQLHHFGFPSLCSVLSSHSRERAACRDLWGISLISLLDCCYSVSCSKTKGKSRKDGGGGSESWKWRLMGKNKRRKSNNSNKTERITTATGAGANMAQRICAREMNRLFVLLFIRHFTPVSLLPWCVMETYRIG